MVVGKALPTPNVLKKTLLTSSQLKHIYILNLLYSRRHPQKCAHKSFKRSSKHIKMFQTASTHDL